MTPRGALSTGGQVETHRGALSAGGNVIARGALSTGGKGGQLGAAAWHSCGTYGGQIWNVRTRVCVTAAWSQT